MSDAVHEIVLEGRGPNALSLASFARVEAELDAIGDRPILMRGAGDAFSAGLDLDALVEDGAAPEALVDGIEAVARRLFLHPAPTVACVNGHAIAGGCLLAIACDHRVLARDPAVRVGMTAVALGLSYPPVVLRILRARLSPHALDRVLLGADRFDPAQALALGIVDELADDPLAVARARATRLAGHPRDTYAHTKRALRAAALEVPEAERAAFRADAMSAWDPAVLRARLAGRRARM